MCVQSAVFIVYFRDSISFFEENYLKNLGEHKWGLLKKLQK